MPSGARFRVVESATARPLHRLLARFAGLLGRLLAQCLCLVRRQERQWQWYLRCRDGSFATFRLPSADADHDARTSEELVDAVACKAGVYQLIGAYRTRATLRSRRSAGEGSEIDPPSRAPRRRRPELDLEKSGSPFRISKDVSPPVASPVCPSAPTLRPDRGAHERDVLQLHRCRVHAHRGARDARMLEERMESTRTAPALDASR